LYLSEILSNIKLKYNSIIEWMFERLPVYQNSGIFKYKVDLDNIKNLSNQLGNPHHHFKTIHIAGTNGKGSTSHILSSILQESGYKTGLYTSPHLKDFRERVKIDGSNIPEADVVEFVSSNKQYFEDNNLSFFEMTVGLAFDYFKNQKVDIAIIEVGMGGRLDSTNIISPELSIITNIGLDHTKFLGTTLKEIAFEKAGIIKENIPVIIGETQLETSEVFNDKANEMGSEILYADQQKKIKFLSDLEGSYQDKNIQTVLCAIRELQKSNWNIAEDAIKLGLSKVQLNTGFIGRWSVLGQSPLTICDTAHNKEGLSIVLEDIKSLNIPIMHFVIGFVNDKDIDLLINLFPEKAHYYFCSPSILRGLDANELKNKFRRKNRHGTVFSSVKDAFDQCKSIAKKDDFIYIGGSTFVVAEII
jgi:dihydrofolate synthase/folylpolyglutamate synthase